MQYGIILGSVVATQKNPELAGLALKVIVACDEQRERSGDPFVAVDSIGARPGDLVLWVGKREASLAISQAPLANLYAVDAAVTGIVDDLG
jgi:ethanolamine utilization protein EutN